MKQLLLLMLLTMSASLSLHATQLTPTSNDFEKQKHQKFIKALIREKMKIDPQGHIQSAEGALVFVSFSMPESLLVEISEEAHAFGIPVVVRGLVNNDFKQTLNKLNALHRYASKNQKQFYGLSIDPLWFEQFDIRAVPALVVTERPIDCVVQTLCKNQPYDLIYGNTSIQHALRIIRDKSPQFRGIATKLLQRVTS